MWKAEITESVWDDRRAEGFWPRKCGHVFGSDETALKVVHQKNTDSAIFDVPVGERRKMLLQ